MAAHSDCEVKEKLFCWMSFLMSFFSLIRVVCGATVDLIEGLYRD